MPVTGNEQNMKYVQKCTGLTFCEFFLVVHTQMYVGKGSVKTTH